MVLGLAELVQVRQESWGLLFYSRTQLRMFFVRSGNWLTPAYFDGRWIFDSLVTDISASPPTSTNQIEATLGKLIDNLVKNGMIFNERH